MQGHEVRLWVSSLYTNVSGKPQNLAEIKMCTFTDIHDPIFSDKRHETNFVRSSCVFFVMQGKGSANFTAQNGLANRVRRTPFSPRRGCALISRSVDFEGLLNLVPELSNRDLQSSLGSLLYVGCGCMHQALAPRISSGHIFLGLVVSS